jgi:head-tail adaptor
MLERITIEDRVTSRNPLEEAVVKLGEVREVNRRARVRAEREALQSVELVDPRDVDDLQIDDLKLPEPGQLSQER